MLITCLKETLRSDYRCGVVAEKCYKEKERKNNIGIIMNGDLRELSPHLSK